MSTKPFCAFTKKVTKESRDSGADTGTTLPCPGKDTTTRNKARSPSLTVKKPRQNPTDPTEAEELLPPALNTRKKQSPDHGTNSRSRQGSPRPDRPSLHSLQPRPGRRARAQERPRPLSALPKGGCSGRRSPAARRGIPGPAEGAATPSRPSWARATHLVSAISTAYAVHPAAGPPRRRRKLAPPAHAQYPQCCLGLVVSMTSRAAHAARPQGILGGVVLQYACIFPQPFNSAPLHYSHSLQQVQ